MIALPLVCCLLGILATEALAWETTIPPAADTSYGRSWGVSVDASRNVVVAGELLGNEVDFGLVSLGGTSGEPIWKQEIVGSAAGAPGAADGSAASPDEGGGGGG